MYYLIYRITNRINGKIYIGCHRTEDKEDGYMGSGIAIRNAIKKYGADNFIKDILFECSSAEEMFTRERELVEIGKHTYNLKQGGKGGWATSTEQRRINGLKGKQARIGMKDTPEVCARRAASLSKATMGKPKPFIQNRYRINGVEYSGMDSATAALGISRYLIRTRCASDAPEWTDWHLLRGRKNTPGQNDLTE